MVWVDPETGQRLTIQATQPASQPMTAADMGGGDFYYDVPPPMPAPLPYNPTPSDFSALTPPPPAPWQPTTTQMPLPSTPWLNGAGSGMLTEVVPESYDLAPVTPLGQQMFLPDPNGQYVDASGMSYSPTMTIDTPYYTPPPQQVYDPTPSFTDPTILGDIYNAPMNPSLAQAFGLTHQDVASYQSLVDLARAPSYDYRERPAGSGFIDPSGENIYQPGQPYSLADVMAASGKVNNDISTYNAMLADMSVGQTAQQMEPASELSRYLTPSGLAVGSPEGPVVQTPGGIGGQFGRLGGVARDVGAYAKDVLAPDMNDIDAAMRISATIRFAQSGQFLDIPTVWRGASDETKTAAMRMVMEPLSGQLALSRVGVDTYELPMWQQYLIDSIAAPVNLIPAASIARTAAAGGLKPALRSLGYEAGQELGATVLGLQGMKLADEAGLGTGGQIAAGLAGGLVGGASPALIRNAPSAGRGLVRGIGALSEVESRALPRFLGNPEAGNIRFGEDEIPTGKEYVVPPGFNELRTGSNNPVRPQRVVDYPKDIEGNSLRHSDVVEIQFKTGLVDEPPIRATVRIKQGENPLESLRLIPEGGGKAITPAQLQNAEVRRVELADPHKMYIDDMVQELGYAVDSDIVKRARNIDSIRGTRNPVKGVRPGDVSISDYVEPRFRGLQDWLANQVEAVRRGETFTNGRSLSGRVVTTERALGTEIQDMARRAITARGGSDDALASATAAETGATIKPKSADYLPEVQRTLIPEPSPAEAAAVEAARIELANALAGEANVIQPASNLPSARREPAWKGIEEQLIEPAPRSDGEGITREAIDEWNARQTERVNRAKEKVEAQKAEAERIATTKEERNALRNAYATVEAAIERESRELAGLQKVTDELAVAEAQRNVSAAAAKKADVVRARWEAKRANAELAQLERIRMAESTRLLSDAGGVQLSMFSNGGGGRGGRTNFRGSGGDFFGAEKPGWMFPAAKKAAREFREIMGFVASAFTTGLGDVSLLARQGGMFLWRPREAGPAMKLAWHAARSNEAADAIHRRLLNSRGAGMLMHHADDAHALPSPTGSGVEAEERYMNRWGNRLPTRRHMQRWNTTFNNAQRVARMESGIRRAEAVYGVGNVPAAEFKRTANWILHATGRGTGSTVDMASKFFQNILFVRFQASLVQRVSDVAWALANTANGTPNVASSIIIRDTVRFVVGTGSLMALMQQGSDMGILPDKAKVKFHIDDWESSKWGTLEVNGRTYDPWGGTRTYAKFILAMYRSVVQQEAKVGFGPQSEIYQNAGRFITGKFTPGYSYLSDLAFGYDGIGRKIDRTSLTPYQRMAFDIVLGGAMGEIMQAFKEDGWAAGLSAFPELPGIGTGGRWGGDAAYDRDEREAKIKIAIEQGFISTADQYDRLNAAQQRDVNIEYNKGFKPQNLNDLNRQQSELVRDEKYDERDKTYATLNAEWEALQGVPHTPEDENVLRKDLRLKKADADRKLGTELATIGEALPVEYKSKQAEYNLLSEYYQMASRFTLDDGRFDYEGYVKAKEEFMLKLGALSPGAEVRMIIEKREQAAKDALPPIFRELDSDQEKLADYWNKPEDVSAIDYVWSHPETEALLRKWGYSPTTIEHIDQLRKWNEEQAASDTSLANGTITKKEWVDDFRDRRTEYNSKIEGIYYDSNASEIPPRSLLERYYDVFESNTDVDGNLNYRAIDAALANFTPEELTLIHENSDKVRSRWATDTVQQYYRDMETIATTKLEGYTYWDIDDAVYAEWAKRKGYTQYGQTWDEFKANALPLLVQETRRRYPDAPESIVRNKAENILADFENDWRKVATKVKLQFRTELPSVYTALSNWDIAGTGKEETDARLQFQPLQ